MRLLTALVLTSSLALGCSSGSGSSSGSPATGGSAGSAGSAAGGAGGTAAGGAAAGGSAAGGSAGSAAGGASADGGTADTYANFAQGFFVKYCVPCHSPTSSDQARDYSTMADITRDHAEIACGVATTKLAGCASFPPPEQFPIGTGAKPTSAERERLVAWIQAGLPQ